MTFGPFNTYGRLGIAHSYFPNGALWAWQVLRLPVWAMPVYQGMIVHSTIPGPGPYGPEVAERTLNAIADESVDRANIIREISIHDSSFSARNVSASLTPQTPFLLETYSANRNNKIFYVNNEPEAYWDYYSEPSASNNLDPYTGIDNLSFWDFLYTLYDSPRRIRPDALALVFLKLKRIFGNSRGNIVLPPCPAGAIYGKLNQPPNPYWQTFFDSTHPLAGGTPTTITVGGQTETKIVPSNLTALHLHYYSAPRGKPNWNINLPMETVAEGAFYLRKSVDWYRQRYLGTNQPLPMDVLLSEFGYLWQISSASVSSHKWLWAGGWDNFRDGLSWWNTWLCWVMRRAPIEFQLAQSSTGTYSDWRAVYACIHEPYHRPYVDYVSGDSYWQTISGLRNQLCFNCDTGSYGVALNAEFINVTNLVQTGRFLPNFSSFPTTSWSDGYGTNQNYRLGPFGACYKVWADVGADAVTGNLATGWLNTTQANQSGAVSIFLKGGYNTVYIPIIKSQFGTYAAGTRFDVKWGSQEYPFGYGEMSEFPDSQVINTIYDDSNNANPPQLIPRSISTDPQSVYSTMVFPVVCYSSSDRNITIKVVRSNGSGPSTGTAFAIGRPIVIPRACSWLTSQ